MTLAQIERRPSEGNSRPGARALPLLLRQVTSIRDRLCTRLVPLEAQDEIVEILDDLVEGSEAAQRLLKVRICLALAIQEARDVGPTPFNEYDCERVGCGVGVGGLDEPVGDLERYGSGD